MLTLVKNIPHNVIGKSNCYLPPPSDNKKVLCLKSCFNNTHFLASVFHAKAIDLYRSLLTILNERRTGLEREAHCAICYCSPIF